MRRRILVVDDEAAVARAVQRVLERRFEVVVAGSPAEGLELAGKISPDLAILDIRMPDMDGFELMARLKDGDPDLDVILMTGSVADVDRKLVRSIREKAFYFIQKPFDREVLQALVARCIDQRRLTEENRDHVQRLEALREEARLFQAGLFPPPEATLHGVRIDGRHVSCDTLCGDFYDYAKAGDDRVAILIADVSGHGAPAAMMTGVVKSSFQSCQADDFAPRAIIRRIASGIGEFRSNRFVTLFCGLLDTRDNRLHYVNAGHPQPIVVNADGQMQRLDPTGPIVSPVLGDVGWEVGDCEFDSGARLVAYTDGLTEASAEGRMFGAERLEEVVRTGNTNGAELLDRILDAVRQHLAGRPPDDDWTLLAVNR